jgi:SfnB family sulfur acquisition oxidoreductase
VISVSTADSRQKPSIPEQLMSAILSEPAVEQAAAVHLIASDAEAIETARTLARYFKLTARERDQHPAPPIDEVERISRSGLLGAGVPRSHGGAEISTTTLVQILQLLSAADGSLGQIHQNHFFFVNRLAAFGTERQKAYYLPGFLAGKRLGNCLSERTGRKGIDTNTSITRQPDGTWRLNGEKYYTTGAYLAHWLPVATAEAGVRGTTVYVDRHAPGVEVINDWSGMGQKNTVSGTAIFRNVLVTEEQILRPPAEEYSPHGLVYAQIMHAAIDTGIAQGALEDAVWFTQNKARAWGEAEVEKAGQDPHLIKQFGELSVQFHAAEALLLRAAELHDTARANARDEQATIDAMIAVGEARAQADRIALQAGTELFEFGGTRSASSQWSLDRYWRDARVHTLHDPVRWKIHHVGNYHLNGVNPPPNS